MLLAHSLLALLIPAVWAAPSRSDPRSNPDRPCGLDGTVHQRFADCNRKRKDATRTISPGLWAHYHDDPLSGLDEPDRTWLLVSSDEKGEKVWLDTASGLMWGGRIDTDEPDEAKCSQPELRGALDAEFHIPTEDDFQTSQLNGLRAFMDFPDGKVFFLKDRDDLFFEGERGAFLDAAAAKGKKRALICVAEGAKPHPPQKKIEVR
jgi:hypothetical protein